MKSRRRFKREHHRIKCKIQKPSSEVSPKENICQGLLDSIDIAIAEYAAIDSGYDQLVNVLAKIFPLPDWEYQYNVPQVKNVDYLDFKINLKGKDATRNVRLNMKDEEIYVPVRFGIRVDFSTGLMYNNFGEDITIYTTA